jgi:hypothetical protein
VENGREGGGGWGGIEGGGPEEVDDGVEAGWESGEGLAGGEDGEGGSGGGSGKGVAGEGRSSRRLRGGASCVRWLTMFLWRLWPGRWMGNSRASREPTRMRFQGRIKRSSRGIVGLGRLSGEAPIRSAQRMFAAPSPSSDAGGQRARAEANAQQKLRPHQ